MFTRLRNWLKKPQPQPEESKIESSKTYVIYSIEDNGDIVTDINLKDYSPESVKSLALLICSFTDVVAHVQTLEAIKNGFISNGLEDLYDIFAQEMMNNIAEEDDQEEEEQEELPCIKPSDML
jgi:hypothetical protein